jgi:hypothetical protein
VGYLTNWVALKLIFQPIHPVKVCCCTVQGRAWVDIDRHVTGC